MQVLGELTAGKLGLAPDAVEDSLPAGPSKAAAPQQQQQQEEEEGEDSDGSMEEMQNRLEALRS